MALLIPARGNNTDLSGTGSWTQHAVPVTAATGATFIAGGATFAQYG